MGRGKIEMKKKDNENYRQVTSSKRRPGLINMASELSIVCGAEIAILVFSPWGSLYSFGSPSVTSVVEKFLNQHALSLGGSKSRSEIERRKKGMGRAKIDNENYRQVTFSKRRPGLFNRASELSIVCGAKIAILVFSPWGNLYSFGSPSVTSVVDKFLNQHGQSSVATGATRRARINELYGQNVDLVNDLEEEKERSEEVKKWLEEVKHGEAWWEAPIQDMGLLELQRLEVCMEVFKKNMAKRADELMAKYAVAPSPSLTMNPVGVVEPLEAGRPNLNPKEWRLWF
ncbi:MADS-box protein AGL42-like [Telopea speciosissima]|uniref:MADS-box protein AGL42-like n=1 Tax=Telopea speciosissima TaxID=54955 RepID=UPI001CC80F38|nr:MADS-box protein AGL42-like [Telopea speciosissima]